MHMRRFNVGVFFLAFAPCLMSASDATAAFIWMMDDNAGNTVTLTDGDADGVITFSGSVGSFMVDGTAISKPAIGGVNVGALGFKPLNVKTSGAVLAPLMINLTDTDFPSTSAREDATIITKSKISDGSVSIDSYFDPANSEFAMGGLQISLGTFTAPPNPTKLNAFSGFVPFNYGSVPYSTTLQLEFEATGALDFSTGFGAINGIQRVPEPSSSVLALIGAVVLGGGRIVRSYRRDR